MRSNEELWLTTFHSDGEDPWQAEHYDAPPFRIGEGWVDASKEYRRFRIIDIWYSTDKHGVHDWGRHVYLEDVSNTPDDRPQLEEPTYYVKD